jgi:dihydropteroate synthase
MTNRVMLVPMLPPPPSLRMPARTALMAVVANLDEAAAAVDAGADLVDLGGIDGGGMTGGGIGGGGGEQKGGGGAEPGGIAEFRARHPGVLICGTGPAADLVRQADVAMATGALLICGDPGSARASGLPADQMIVEVLPGGVKEAVEAGWTVLVDADRAARLAAGAGPTAPGDQGRADAPAAQAEDDERAELAGIVAIAAISGWLGAAAVRTSHPQPVRRALDMTASILGTRPPARTVRGLA